MLIPTIPEYKHSLEDFFECQNKNKNLQSSQNTSLQMEPFSEEPCSKPTTEIECPDCHLDMQYDRLYCQFECLQCGQRCNFSLFDDYEYEIMEYLYGN